MKACPKGRLPRSLPAAVAWMLREWSAAQLFEEVLKNQTNKDCISIRGMHRILRIVIPGALAQDDDKWELLMLLI